MTDGNEDRRDYNNLKPMLRELSEESSEKAVKRMLVMLGIDHENPIEVQKDLAALREIRQMHDDEEYQKDQLHLRQWRMAVDGVKAKGMTASVTFLFLGGLSILVYGVLNKLGLTR